jgi:GNAT superfamily N-acetyltransferase
VTPQATSAGRAIVRLCPGRVNNRGRYRRAVSRLELRCFSDEFLPHAGELLAERHRAHRAAEPLLPSRYENAEAAAAEVATLARSEGASGAVAIRGSRVVGYLLGVRKSDEIWGTNVWVETAGHAVEVAEGLRDLYGAAAARWLEEGRDRHYALVPATDPALLDAWSRVGFGHQHAYGIREVPEAAWPEGVRRAEERDLDALVELAPLLQDHQSLSPVFGGGLPEESEDELRAEILDDLAKAEVGDLVADHDGRIVGAFQIVPVELSSVHAGLARPEGAALLGWAATRPDVRGSGAGLALTEAAFAWARERGHETMVTDWRVTNLLSSRFWPARGFRESFLRLYRRIP